MSVDVEDWDRISCKGSCRKQTRESATLGFHMELSTLTVGVEVGQLATKGDMKVSACSGVSGVSNAALYHWSAATLERAMSCGSDREGEPRAGFTETEEGSCVEMMRVQTVENGCRLGRLQNKPNLREIRLL